MKTTFQNTCAVVLAGGKGTRMNSTLPKVLHPLGGKPLIERTLDKLDQLNLGQIIIVVGHQADLVINKLGQHRQYAFQQQPLGTGHAVLEALPTLQPGTKTILVLNGDDSAFYLLSTLKDIIGKHQKSGAVMTILTTIKEEAEVSGRVIRDGQGKMTGIKANSLLTKEELAKNHEFVCGLYLFQRSFLEEMLPGVEISPKGEYNITGLIKPVLQSSGLQDLQLPNSDEWQSINTQQELIKANRLWSKIFNLKENHNEQEDRKRKS